VSSEERRGGRTEKRIIHVFIFEKTSVLSYDWKRLLSSEIMEIRFVYNGAGAVAVPPV
jgi:hypothetical protein